MSLSVIDVDSARWDDEVVRSALPVLVDFWNPRCSPCIALMPTLEAFADEYAGQVKVVKVNCDHNQDIVARLGVRGVPHLVLLKSGEAAAVVAGRTRTRIVAEVELHLDRRGDAPHVSAEVVQSGAWCGDVARKQAAIATARANLATGPSVILDSTLHLAPPGRDDEASNVYCAAFGTSDPTEIEARAGLPARTLMLASAALSACERWDVDEKGGPRRLPHVAPVVGAPVAALEAIRVGADPLAITRSYVVELLDRLDSLRDHADRELTSDQRGLLRRLATLHRDHCTDPAAFRELRREATGATDAATGELPTAALQFAEALAWPLAGLVDELPEIVTRVHGSLCACLSPEQPSPDDKALVDAVDALMQEVEERSKSEPALDIEAEYAEFRARPEVVALRQSDFRARQVQRDRAAAEAYAPFAVDLLIGAFRKA